MSLDEMREELEALQHALEATEKRLQVRYTVADSYYRSYLQKEIKRLTPKWELIDVTIAIFSTVDSPKGYIRRFQGFYDVDALRDAKTGKFRYDADLTKREIGACLIDFRARWGWHATGIPADSTTEPIWIETSDFEFIDEPNGAQVKTLTVIEDEEETYWAAPMDRFYALTDEEKEEMMELVV